MSATTGIARRRVGAGGEGSAPGGRAPVDDRAMVVDGVHALERAVEARPWSREMLAGELAHPTRAWFVAEDAGAIVAFAGSARLGGDVHVLRLTVGTAHRRLGVGRALLTDLVDLAGRDGAASVTLEVRVDNAAARALYRGEGFEERGRRPGYYPDGEDALILTRTLGAVLGRDDESEVG